MDVGAQELAFFAAQKNKLDAAIAAVQRDYKITLARLRSATCTARRGLGLRCRILRAEQGLLRVRRTSLQNMMRVVQLEMEGRVDEAEALAERNLAYVTPRVVGLQHTVAALQAEVDALHAEIAPETQTE